MGILLAIANMKYQAITWDSLKCEIESSERRAMVPNDQLINDPNSVDSILPSLDLGDGRIFIETIGHDELADGADYALVLNDDPIQYRHIITMCPIHAMKMECSPLGVKNQLEAHTQQLRARYQRANATWHYLGRGVEDIKARASIRGPADTDPIKQAKWNVLVHDCTVKDHQWEDMEFTTLEDEELESIREAKKEAISEIPVTDWFKRSFEVLDKAILSNEKTLVHCAQGVSRSATVIIAYLINRCRVSAEAATAFIKEKRPCVAPRFEEQLKAYAEALQNTTQGSLPCYYRREARSTRRGDRS